MRAHRPHAFVNGTLHWLAVRRTNDASNYFILTFDVGSESCSGMMTPVIFVFELSMSVKLQLSVSGDGKSIALFSGYYEDDSNAVHLLDIWVMKEYGMHESWTKLTTLRPLGPEGSVRMIVARALYFRKTGEIVVELFNEDGCRGFWLYTSCPGRASITFNRSSEEPMEKIPWILWIQILHHPFL